MNHIPETPKWAVLFISEREDNPPGYAEMDEATMAEVAKIDGFLGYDSTRSGKNGIFISYWRDEEAIEKWKNHELHLRAKKEGRGRWYDAYRSVICKIADWRDFRREIITPTEREI